MASPSRSFLGRRSPGRTLTVLHPAFALTGVLHAIGGPLLPSLASTFHLSDSQSALLFLAYFSRTSLGALLCRRNHPPPLTIRFLGSCSARACVAPPNTTLP